MDVEIARTMALIRGKDPRIYDPSTKFFSAEAPAVEKKKTQKPMLAKDVIREQVAKKLHRVLVFASGSS